MRHLKWIIYCRCQLTVCVASGHAFFLFFLGLPFGQPLFYMYENTSQQIALKEICEADGLGPWATSSALQHKFAIVGLTFTNRMRPELKKHIFFLPEETTSGPGVVGTLRNVLQVGPAGNPASHTPITPVGSASSNPMRASPNPPESPSISPHNSLIMTVQAALRQNTTADLNWPVGNEDLHVPQIDTPAVDASGHAQHRQEMHQQHMEALAEMGLDVSLEPPPAPLPPPPAALAPPPNSSHSVQNSYSFQLPGTPAMLSPLQMTPALGSLHSSFTPHTMQHTGQSPARGTSKRSWDPLLHSESLHKDRAVIVYLRAGTTYGDNNATFL